MVDAALLARPKGLLTALAAVHSRATASELLDLAKERVTDDTIFSEHPPFFWSAEISSDRIDSYFTRMMPSTLKNFAAEAEEGVPFQNSHNSRQLPLGRSLTGRYTGAQGNGVARVSADFYTVSGLKLADLNTDDFLIGMRTGIVSDVSVGFTGGDVFCSLCKRDLFDWDCPHIPGVEYMQTDAKGNEEGRELCLGLIEDAHLAEVSAVYAGATPGAGITKIYRAIEQGEMTSDLERMVEQQYRMKLDLPALTKRAAPARQEEPMSTEKPTELDLLNTRLAQTEQERDAGKQAMVAIRAALLEAGALPDADPASAVRHLHGEIKRLTPLADDGTAYRADLIASALAEGVRAIGEHFATEAYKTAFTTMPVETIKRMHDDWKAVADRALQGGRVTVDTETTRPSRGRPREAYIS